LAATQQLWLTVFEDPVGPAWPPSVSDMRWRVSLTASDTLHGCAHEMPFRTSPVFPVTREFVIPALGEAETYYFYFLCFDPAFEVLGRLVDGAPPEWKSGLLFTLGLSSVVIISKDSDLLDRVESVTRSRPRATEIWTVHGSAITNVMWHCREATDVPPSALRIHSYEQLGLAARTVVDEFLASISLLVPKVAVHMPEELPTFLQLVRLVNELVVEMVYATAPAGGPPETLSEYCEADFRNGAALAETILHQNTDRLVQINAALAYLATQALSGAVPILERRSLIRRYSLLGVGTAILALTRIARSIERAFAEGAVETILDKHAAESVPLPGLDELPRYDASDWSAYSFDRWEGQVEPREPYPKLPYFSGRLGFRETEYTISAALQSLAAGAGPEWSLLTLTHEMVHGHVRNIISLIFQGQPEHLPEPKWQQFYSRFEARLERQLSRDNLLDTLRAVILAYCCVAITHGSLTREADARPDPTSREVRLGFYLPKSEALWLAFEGEIRNISEVFVHVLDLHYFYLSSLAAFVPMIWRSWSKLPQVRGDLRQYLLRSLLVVSSKTKGKSTDRFRQSRAHLRELLEPLASRDIAGRSTILAAVETLKSDAESERLFPPFYAGLGLVDLANHVLASGAIRGALLKADAHLAIKTDDARFEDWLDYALPDEFTDDSILSPAAYLADRIGKKAHAEESLDLEFETVRMFLACCSHIENGDSA
jgi:hypothetical protein